MLNHLKIKYLRVGLFCGLILTLNPYVYAQGIPGEGEGGEGEVAKLITNLGAFLGYSIGAPTPPTPNSSLITSPTQTITSLQNLILLQLGTIMSPTIVDPNNSEATALNGKTNVIYKQYNTPSTSGTNTETSGSQATLTVSPLIDVPPYQANPVSQSILNLTTTPDISNCLQISCANPSSKNDTLVVKCCAEKTPVYRTQIGINVLGNIPTPETMYSPLATAINNEMNANTLIEPQELAVNSKTPSPQGKSGSGDSNTPPTIGLIANNQAQEAENFIRYATEAVSPPEQATYETYQNYYNTATKIPKNPTADQLKKAANAQTLLSNYLSSWRSFTAQKSVAVSNLYHILSKRMPQPGSANQTSSQALSEFNMATKRLYDPKSDGKQWINEINTASPATVQKEIALLLAEMNYQLYLNRQDQERLLLTNSIILMRLGRLVSPANLQPPTQ
jgi:intracellular multiplication protein IcmX